MKKVRKYPRRFGIEKVRAEIKEQGGEPSLLQHAMISNNDLKNIHLRLNSVLIRKKIDASNILTEEDLKMIISSIKMLENKLKPISKK